jgi:hypothetical protein
METINAWTAHPGYGSSPVREVVGTTKNGHKSVHESRAYLPVCLHLTGNRQVNMAFCTAPAVLLSNRYMLH